VKQRSPTERCSVVKRTGNMTVARQFT